MCCKNFVSRIVPFFITFSLGLLIASFFVPIVPKFNFKNNDGRRGMRNQYRQMQRENSRLKQENKDLKEQLRLAGSEGDIPESNLPNAYVHFDGDGHGHSVGYRTSTSDGQVKR